MKKSELSEQDIKTKYITPALVKAGWDKKHQLREEVSFTVGKIKVRGKMVTRGKPKRADYILYYKPNIPIAVIEAKSNDNPVGAGLQQAKDYAKTLDIPFVYSSNGDGFVEYDRTESEGKVEKRLSLEDFPPPEELWKRYKAWKGIEDEEEEIVEQPYYVGKVTETPRYYQQIAINRTIEAIAKGENRILLVMATGTGKTLTAFQIIWRLWKSGQNQRILYLADRNILVDSPRNKYFGPFGDVVTKIKRDNISKAHEIYFGLYQSVVGDENHDDVFKEYSRDFFDLIIVDECHRGSVRANSQWRRVLEYFESATQIGMTATPKENSEVSNIHYFGEPLYTYSLKQGIEDGFLAPYKVMRYTIDRDVEGWRPKQGKKDVYGNLIPDRIYNKKDFDRLLVADKRTALVALKVTQFLENHGPYSRTIVFCQDIDHADRMRRALVNLNAVRVNKNDEYVVRITGDVPKSQMYLYDFMDSGKTFPVIATTSELLSTGVDVPNCELIVLDRELNSITMFKQIIGRGTRIDEDNEKHYFTIMDFRHVTRHFADPEFDGKPIQDDDFETGDPPEDTTESGDDEDEVVEPGEEEIVELPPDLEGGGEIEDDKPRKYYVKDVEFHVINEQIIYYGEDGKPVTESLKDFSRKNILEEYESLDDFLQHWKESDKKQAIIKELREKGVIFEELQKEVGKDLDPFDLICHIAFDQPPLTRKERAEQVKKQDYFGKYSETAQEVLKGLLDKYADGGIENLENPKVLKLEPFNKLGSVTEILDEFGGKEEYEKAIQQIEQDLYKTAS